MFGSRPQPFAAQFALLPFEILADAVCNVIEQLLLLAQKRSLPGDRLFRLVVNLDGADLCSPDRDRRMQTPRSVDEVRQCVSTAKVFDSGGGVLGVLPAGRKGLKHPAEN